MTKFSAFQPGFRRNWNPRSISEIPIRVMEGGEEKRPGTVCSPPSLDYSHAKANSKATDSA